MKREILSPAAPTPAGPYSQAVEESGTVYCSGQIGVSRATGQPEGSVAAQTKRALENISEVLKTSGLGLDDVVKTTVFLADMALFAQMNEEYAKHFKAPYPARTTVQAAPPKGALVEIDAVARKKSP